MVFQSITISVFAWHGVRVKNSWLLVAVISSLPAVLGCLRVIWANREGRFTRTLLCLGTLLGFAAISFANRPDYWGVAATQRLLTPLVRLDPAGYIDASTGEVGRLHIYTVHSIAIAFLQLALYLGLILILIERRKRRPAPLPQWILRWDNFPVLYSVYAMLGLLCLLLSGLSFFLDAYGVSLVAVLVLWRLVVWYFDEGATVGFYRPAFEMPTPREVLAANSAETGGRVIAVCASGGGIHASAWTTKVLTELEKQHRHHFAPLLRVISCVSGGSVGAMNFAGAFTPTTGQIQDFMLDYSNTQSRISSLPAALGGWFLFDLPRLFIPWLPSWLNRGWSLERRWDIDGFYNWSLGAWGHQAWLGRRPAVLFNCTAVEYGKTCRLRHLYDGAPSRPHHATAAGRRIQPELSKPHRPHRRRHGANGRAHVGYLSLCHPGLPPASHVRSVAELVVCGRRLLRQFWRHDRPRISRPGLYGNARPGMQDAGLRQKAPRSAEPASADS